MLPMLCCVVFHEAVMFGSAPFFLVSCFFFSFSIDTNMELLYNMTSDPHWYP